MIAACPTCGARCRIERGSLPASGARVRCPRCGAVFRVRSVAEAPARPEAQIAAPVSEPKPAPEPSRAAPPTDAGSERLVLLADSEVEAGKALANTLADWGLQPILVHDGVEAILTIQRTLPRVVILDAALPKMFGFQICELMKRNDSLREIRVVLMGAIHDRARYRRPPQELYGADAYVERPQIPEALRTVLRGFGLSLDGGAAAPTPAAEMPTAEMPVMERVEPTVRKSVAPPPAREVIPQPAASHAPEPLPEPTADPFANAVPEPAPQPVAEPKLEIAEPPASAPVARSAPAQADAPPVATPTGEDSEVVAAERLARIIISDVVLYNQEKFEAAIRTGNIVQAMDADMQEGRAHFGQRVPASLRESRDFLTDELLRVARSRGLK